MTKNYKKQKEFIPKGLPENLGQKTWDLMHFNSDYEFPTKEKFWLEEMNKCLESEEYFYNNYILINGKKPEPISDGYFKRIRIIKARRNPSRYFPIINPKEEVLEKLTERYLQIIKLKFRGIE